MRFNRRTILLAALILMSLGLARFAFPTAGSESQFALPAPRPLADRLAPDHRDAWLLVLGRKGAARQCLFAAVGPEGSLVGVREFSVNSSTLTLHCAIINGAMLFESAGSFPLEKPGVAPDFYSSGSVNVSPQEQAFWANVWSDHPTGSVWRAENDHFCAPTGSISPCCCSRFCGRCGRSE